VIIAVVVAVRVMVMLHPAVVSIPIAGVKALAVMTRPYPVRACIGGTRPVSVVPSITTAFGIPVTIEPNRLAARANRADGEHTRPRRRPDSNSEG
jgi:hypothetical protein